MNSILKPKKTPKADLEHRRFLYFEIGLVVVLSVVFTAFNWPSSDEEFYFEPPKKDTTFYTAQEVYMFKPLPQSPSNTPKTKPVIKPHVTKVNPIKVNPVTNVPPPVVVQPEIDNSKPDTTVGNKGPDKSNNPLPSNLIKVDKMPQFPGGEAAMNDFIRANIQYTEFAKKNNFSGTVNLKFIVTAEGKLTDFKVEKGVRNSGLNEEVIRVFSIMPTWEPGYRNGKPQPFMVSYPVRFEFEE